MDLFFTGVNCSILILPPPPNCSAFSANCEDCTVVAVSAANLSCVWCPVPNVTVLALFQVNGTCVPPGSACPAPLSSDCTPPIVIVIPPCPDNCSFQGSCANLTCDANGKGTVDPKAVPGNLNKNLSQLCQSQNISNKTAQVCLCHDSYTGINCGVHAAIADYSSYIAGGIAGGAIAGIVLGIIICCAAAGGGTFAAYNRLSPDDDAKIHTSPLYESNQKGGDNPLFGGEKDAV